VTAHRLDVAGLIPLRAARIIAAVLAILLAAVSAMAQVGPGEDVTSKVGFDQRLGESVDLSLSFVDESGQSVTLRELAEDKPVVLIMAYYECPMLCTLVLNGANECLRNLAFTAGDEFEVIVVSIDPEETPALADAKKYHYVRKYNRYGAEDGWHFLTGDEPQIRALADSIGFRYAYDPRSGEYAHVSGLVVLTPEGVIARYFYGIDFPAKDMRLALVDASDGRIGGVTESLLLMCYQYDSNLGRYTFAVMNAVRAAGAVTVCALFGGIIIALRRERRRTTGAVATDAEAREEPLND
jgi:protein SCO1/2